MTYYCCKTFTISDENTGGYKISVAKHVRNQRTPVMLVVDAQTSTNLSKAGTRCDSARNRAICTGCRQCTTTPLTGHSHVPDYDLDSNAFSRDRLLRSNLFKRLYLGRTSGYESGFERGEPVWTAKQILPIPKVLRGRIIILQYLSFGTISETPCRARSYPRPEFPAFR